ncbi:hypothetical protein DUNSADRAFT_16319 [Dunaliella salina]|uniref:Uncharacterized protein n=1 Tax=Dunaliella salina TaxID=3046 RepID=A0ABQ7G3T2_DUNSA|nr:hypothetical protein DUNSADRAFT_16319 [Dunaliella salina]|eukprot:KAF5829269.1 hypothetical protein DUNSADRAFT_16319 [Dunaliella salina]
MTLVLPSGCCTGAVAIGGGAVATSQRGAAATLQWGSSVRTQWGSGAAMLWAALPGAAGAERPAAGDGFAAAATEPPAAAIGDNDVGDKGESGGERNPIGEAGNEIGVAEGGGEIAGKDAGGVSAPDMLAGSRSWGYCKGGEAGRDTGEDAGGCGYVHSACACLAVDRRGFEAKGGFGGCGGRCVVEGGVSDGVGCGGWCVVEGGGGGESACTAVAPGDGSSCCWGRKRLRRGGAAEREAGGGAATVAGLGGDGIGTEGLAWSTTLLLTAGLGGDGAVQLGG